MTDKSISELVRSSINSHGEVTDLQTFETMIFYTEPAEYSGSVTVNYGEDPAWGMSHAHMGFRNTGNERFPVTLEYNRLHIYRRYGQALGWDMDRTIEEMEKHRRFLRSLTVSPPMAEGSIGGSPARAYLTVPGVLSVPVRLVDFSWVVNKRDTAGKILIMTMSCQFTEAPLSRFTSKDIISTGYDRRRG